MQSPRNLREWQQAVERKLASGKQGTRIAISHANDKADEVRGEVDDFKALTPTAPIELSVQTATYIDANRKRRGSVTIDFPDVVLSTNGAPVVINNYELQGQDQADTSKPFLTLSTSDISSVYAADLPAGSTWKFRVRANGGSTILPGEWSATVQTVIAADTTPPPQPSTPVATAVSGGVKVTWDGLAAGGGSMPGDFDRVELAFGMSASPTTVIDTYYSASFTIQPKTSYNTTHYFRLRAFDSSGNASAWSAQATAIPTPLVDVDVIISKIDAATTEITNIGRAAILDGAINSLKLADGAVSLIKIQDQIISLGKLDTAANAKIQKGIDDAFAAQSTANTASGNANTAISNAAAADSKAGAAQTAADKAQAVVDARIAAGVNLNVNGDFDAMPISSPPLGWPTRSLTTVQASTTTARSGTNVLKATPTTNSAYAYTDYFASAQARTFYVEYWCRLDQAVIAGNENLNLGAFFVQQDAAGTVAGAVAVYTNGTSYPGVKLSDLSTTAWTKFAVTWTTTQANNVKLRVGPRLPAGTTTSNSFEVDGFRVIDITESKAALDAAATAQAKADLAFTNAGTAFTNAGLAQTSADGKNNVMYLAALPSTTAWADGDTVFIRTAPGAPITAQWKWVKTGPTTGSWSQETLGHQVLASIDLGKATIGELNGIYVKAFSLSADTLKIGSGANLFPDPKMIDTAGWPVPAGVTLDAVGTGKNGQGSVLIAASSSQVGSYYAISDATKRITVAPNSSYRLSIWVRAAQVIPAGGVAFYARQYPVDGSAFSFTTPSLVTNDVNTVGGDGTIPANTWTLMSGVITTGATLSTLVVGPHKQTSMTGAVRFSDPAVEVMGIGRLIVDGTIQGNHVATNSITAKHMTITDLTNFAPSLAESPTDYTLTNQMSIVTSGLDPSGWRFHVTDATSESRAYGPYMAVSPGENLWMGANLYRGSGTISAYLRYYFYDSNKALIAGGSGTQYIGVPQLSTSPSGTRMEGGAVVPAGAAYTRWTLIVAAGTGSTGFYNIQGRRRLAAELIVDGTISSNAIATNAVTAKQILVGDFQNLAIGSDFEDATAVPWALQPTHTITTAQKKSGTSSLRLAATTGTQKSTFTNDMRVKEGEQWYFKLHAYIDATFNGTGPGPSSGSPHSPALRCRPSTSPRSRAQRGRRCRWK